MTIHYDTTTRKRLNGEWPSLILKTCSGKKFRLRSLNMAAEDCKNIVNLFIATLSRLEKVSCLMTDSVSKNLQIENLIAATLVSHHIPMHLLCVSHTCEVFDSGNLHVLNQIEKMLGLKEKIMFLSKGIAQVAINALSKLATNDGHKSSLYEEFDAELAKSNKPKKFSIFKERRFALLGYTAAAVIDHFTDLQNTISNTNSQNQLIQAAKLYFTIEYIKIALTCIAWFTYKVTMPFLNMCEIETPNTLLTILPMLKIDLESGKLNTLDNYHVEYSFKPTEPTSTSGRIIMERFCKKAATDLERQRARIFGFSAEECCVTYLTTVSTDVLENLPIHNLDCERDLAIMDKIASRAAVCSNRNFTAKGMKDDMTLYQAKVAKIDKETKKISNILDVDEKKWFESQAEITKAKIAE